MADKAMLLDAGRDGPGDEVAAAFMNEPKITALTEQRYAFIPPGVRPDQYAADMGSCTSP